MKISERVEAVRVLESLHADQLNELRTRDKELYALENKAHALQQEFSVKMTQIRNMISSKIDARDAMLSKVQRLELTINDLINS